MSRLYRREENLTNCGTGTRAALKMLGFSDCYHMVTVHQNILTHAEEWIRAIEWKYEGKGTWGKADWDRLLGEAQSLVDIPPALFGAEIAEAYPDAKVVILNRDPEKWYVSALNTTANVDKNLRGALWLAYVATFDARFRNMFRFFGKLYGTAMGGFDHAKEKDKALAWFKRQYDEFRERIPAERRIEWTVQDGWGPLCAHLGVPVPMERDEATGEMVEVPFPRLNDRDSFKARVAVSKKEALQRAHEGFFAMVGRVAILGGLGALAWHQYVRRR